MAITIQVSDEIWEILNKEKKAGETFDEVLKRKLKVCDVNAKQRSDKTKTKKV